MALGVALTFAVNDLDDPGASTMKDRAREQRGVMGTPSQSASTAVAIVVRVAGSAARPPRWGHVRNEWRKSLQIKQPT